jgi:hypothetical protein
MVAAACAAALGVTNLTGCYTQLAVPPSPDVTLPPSTNSRDSEEYFPPSRWSRYPEDFLYDPYYSGLSYNNGYYDPTWDRTGYPGYYNTPWWLDPRNRSGGGGAFPDSTRERQRDGRLLWNGGGHPVLPPASSSDAVGELSTPPGSIGASGTASQTDTTTTQDKNAKSKKKGSGRKLWR